MCECCTCERCVHRLHAPQFPLFVPSHFSLTFFFADLVAAGTARATSDTEGSSPNVKTQKTPWAKSTG